VIVAEGIIKKYGNLEVLKGVNIHISEGEVVAIVGKSGAGKSTLLHILGTLDRADSGSLLFKGTDVNKLNNTDLSKFRNSTIGFVFQFHYLLPEFTALENVCIPGYIANKQENEVIKEGKKWLDYLGLSERMNHKPGSLSGGEQQRVSVARALINRPAIIFADEPSGNLDIQSSQELHSLIFTLRKDFNQTFVLVTHNMDLAKMSDRCLEMRDGIILD
jgi:lipoprotein-releasing system ATP-binding protein